MKRALVTGASGFVGAAVVRQMVRQGRPVAVLLRPASDTRRIGDLLDRVQVIRGDIFRLGEVREALAAFAPEGVVHLAWEGVRGSDRNNVDQAKNVGAAIELYLLTEALGAARFVGVGSQAEYGPQSGRIREDAPLAPTTVYGAAKLAVCVLLERMAVVSGRSFAWLRLFSSYGPGDDPSWLIPYLVRRLLLGERPALTAADQRWDFLHVEDVARAVIATLDCDVSGVFNLGSGEARPLREVITFIRDYIDPSLPLGFGEVQYRADQVMHLEADISALTRATGFVPAVPLADGVRGVVDHLRGDLGLGDPSRRA